MSDLTITAANIVLVSGDVATKNAAEAVTAGNWLYAVPSAITVGIASKSDVAKQTVIGLALNSAGVGQPVNYALPGAVVSFGAILTVARWYLLGAVGATRPVADQTTGDYVTQVGYALTTSNMQLKIVNTALQAP